jgi:hypothetical protein
MVLNPGQYISQCASKDEHILHQFGKGRKNMRSQKVLKTAPKNNVDLKLCINRADKIVNHVL